MSLKNKSMKPRRFFVLVITFVSTLFCGSVTSTANGRSLPITSISTSFSFFQETVNVRNGKTLDEGEHLPILFIGSSDTLLTGARDSLAYAVMVLEKAVGTIQELQNTQNKLRRDYARLSNICSELIRNENLLKASLDSTSTRLVIMQDSLSASKEKVADVNALQMKAERERDRLRKVDLILISIVLVLLCLVFYLLYRLPKINQNEHEHIEINTDENSSSTISLKFDPVSYDAAVDAWIHINNNLASLGKNRWKIQKVYAYLAGYDIDKVEMQQEMASLDDEHKEAVSIIISDIERFKLQHLTALEQGLTIQSGYECKLKDAVRFPVGKVFDTALDEELTGESVKEGDIISKVASLGYLFPGSRNGSYRVKSNVLV